MAYYLTIDSKEENRPLDLRTMEGFKRHSNLQNNLYTLEEIDLFTKDYKDEKDLKLALYYSGLITSDEIEKNITIRRKDHKKLLPIKYGIVYSNMKEYLSVEKLRNIIGRKMNDVNFVNDFVNQYQFSYKSENIVSEFKGLLNSDEKSKIYMFIDDFLKSELYEKDKKTNKTKLRYKSLHDLAMFVSNWNDINKQLDKIEEYQKLKEDLLSIKELLQFDEKEDKNYRYDELGYIVRDDEEVYWGFPDEPIPDYQKPENNLKGKRR